jgi:hypothetical protein
VRDPENGGRGEIKPEKAREPKRAIIAVAKKKREAKGRRGLVKYRMEEE